MNRNVNWNRSKAKKNDAKIKKSISFQKYLPSPPQLDTITEHPSEENSTPNLSWARTVPSFLQNISKSAFLIDWEILLQRHRALTLPATRNQNKLPRKYGLPQTSHVDPNHNFSSSSCSHKHKAL